MLSGLLLALLSTGFIGLVGLKPDQREILIKHLANLMPRLNSFNKA
jgi:hypothetical protein